MAAGVLSLSATAFRCDSASFARFVAINSAASARCASTLFGSSFSASFRDVSASAWRSVASRNWASAMRAVADFGSAATAFRNAAFGFVAPALFQTDDAQAGVAGAGAGIQLDRLFELLHRVIEITQAGEGIA